eukprot:TRINITY_DN11160_c0_g1_i1.p1 TRINITY_DN11160_c0_g1~~TRINITY_DN11160_c0_g1_i1.p1  ORF type:complete len:157 (+),score=36.61 TRINITY_DN11160_c0_g1_i1:3-473(+)
MASYSSMQILLPKMINLRFDSKSFLSPERPTAKMQDSPGVAKLFQKKKATFCPKPEDTNLKREGYLCNTDLSIPSLFFDEQHHDMQATSYCYNRPKNKLKRRPCSLLKNSAADFFKPSTIANKSFRDFDNQIEASNKWLSGSYCDPAVSILSLIHI